VNKHLHLVGIGGIGMSGLALLLLKEGYRVSGSDIKESQILKKLISLGAEIYIGHSGENVKGADLVIYSSAIKEDNPEIKMARRKKISLIKRAEMLAELMRDKIAITVTGAHGKTTTASLISWLLLKRDFSPCFALGGVLRGLGENALLGKGKYFVAEADESDGTFLKFSPYYSVITNIDHEHIDFYGNFENLLNAFGDFIANTKDCLIACGDDLNLRYILKDFNKKYLLYGRSSDCHIRAEDIRLLNFFSEFNCVYKGGNLGRVSLALVGTHNVINSLAVIGLGMELGIDFNQIRDALKSFPGLERRFQVKIESKDFLLIDDYGHHPTEIKATLEAAKNCGYKRLICVFQPHRYSRTKLLFKEFCKCFDSADLLIITDIYSADEEPIEGIDSEVLLRKLEESGKRNCFFLPKEEIVEYLLNIISSGDLVVTLGAGDIGRLSDELAKRIKEEIKIEF